MGLSQWQVRSPRWLERTLPLVGKLSLVCPDTPTVPGQYNRWLVLASGDDGRGTEFVGGLGDPLEDVVARAEAGMVLDLKAALALLGG